jgi:hypothetical protein
MELAHANRIAHGDKQKFSQTALDCLQEKDGENPGTFQCRQKHAMKSGCRKRANLLTGSWLQSEPPWITFIR